MLTQQSKRDKQKLATVGHRLRCHDLFSAESIDYSHVLEQIVLLSGPLPVDVFEDFAGPLAPCAFRWMHGSGHMHIDVFLSQGVHLTIEPTELVTWADIVALERYGQSDLEEGIATLCPELEAVLDSIFDQHHWAPDLADFRTAVDRIGRDRGVSFRFGGVETWTPADDASAHDEVVFLEASASREDSYDITKELDAAMARFLTSPKSSNARTRWPRLALGIVWPHEE